jgi:hypothetical protein
MRWKTRTEYLNSRSAVSEKNGWLANLSWLNSVDVGVWLSAAVGERLAVGGDIIVEVVEWLNTAQSELLDGIANLWR